MEKMAEALESYGYQVVNVDYPSRDKTVEQLARSVVPQAVQECRALGAQRIEFVTHSMGGILVRYYLAQHSIPELGRVVMLSPPNQGSEVVDELAAYPGFKFVNGPAGYQLGTDETSIPLSLGPVDYEVGVITGDRSINWILSWLIPGEDDGKVSVERAKLEGMRDFMVVHHSHPFIMRADAVILQTINFLQRGYFIHADRVQ
jgi:pimeloyl-ACP methyl ester carboxylesterase